MVMAGCIIISNIRPAETGVYPTLHLLIIAFLQIKQRTNKVTILVTMYALSYREDGEFEVVIPRVKLLDTNCALNDSIKCKPRSEPLCQVLGQ